MDFITIGGILIALGAILGGNYLEGGHVSSLTQLTAFLIVFGGTMGAVMVQTPIPVLARALKLLPWVVLPPKLDMTASAQRIVEIATITRKGGLLSAEEESENEQDEVLRRMLVLLVSGYEPESLREIIEIEIDSSESADLRAAAVFESMGGYCPTIGIIGAVMGLIHVMNNLADPTKLGGGIAVAFVATIYGVGLANIVFLPVANKLKTIIEDRTNLHELMLEGIVSILRGENPRTIESKLQSFSSQQKL